MHVINSFSGKYSFLSNFVGGVEEKYQAAKATTLEDRDYVLQSKTPGISKRRGKNIKMREDWDEIKVTVMELLLIEKFSNPLYKDLLISTAPAILIEGNTWGDTFWGVCNNVGENRLGELLMKIRDQFILKNVQSRPANFDLFASSVET